MKTIRRTLLLAFLATITTQLAGCGAADIQYAKLYRQNRDYTRANAMLEKALKDDGTNDEAWYLYIVNLYDLKQFEKIATNIDTAMLYAATHRGELQTLKHNTWIQLYNGGLNTYNANPESKEAQQAAIGYLESARKLEPEQPETYELLGSVYYSAGDTAKGLANYIAEINQISAAYEQGVTMGLMLRQTPEAVERAIGGAPARKTTVSIGGNDSAWIYIYPSKQSFIYFEKQPKPPYAWQLSGWRVTSLEAEGMQPIRVSTQAYALVANDYYQKGLATLGRGDKSGASSQFDKAVPLLMTLQQIDPSDEFAAQAIPDIYTRLERTDKAKQEYERILSEHPSKAMYVSYGTLLMKSNDYQGAVNAYEKALSLAPNDEAALFDIAAAYKNWAAADQKTKNPNYKAELDKSTEYFERLHAINKTDAAALENLAENYDILGKKDKMITLVSEFEALKNTDAANSAEYWDWLAKIYARANRPGDAQAAYAKADQLRQGHK